MEAIGKAKQQIAALVQNIATRESSLVRGVLNHKVKSTKAQRATARRGIKVRQPKVDLSSLSGGSGRYRPKALEGVIPGDVEVRVADNYAPTSPRDKTKAYAIHRSFAKS